VREAGTRLRSALAAYREKEDLISIGAYQPGTDPLLDATIALRPRIEAFLRQRVDEPSAVDEADAQLIALADELFRRPPVAGEVLDGPPAAPPGPPARQAAMGAPAGAGLAIPGLQLTA
jgi:flagellum-specific ATP synthase